MEKILLKLSGELFGTQQGSGGDLAVVRSLVDQIRQLCGQYQISIVIGAGNFFRGAQTAIAAHLSRGTADLVGMMGTVMNSLMLQDLFDQAGVPSTILTALHVPSVGKMINQHRINQAVNEGKVIIFGGGSGNPFMTTDTTAVLRALQGGADCLWKATKVDHLYDQDPLKHPDAQIISRCSHDEAIAKKLAIMDMTALTLAAQYRLPLRFFNIFAEQALLKAAQNETFGSIISS